MYAWTTRQWKYLHQPKLGDRLNDLVEDPYELSDALGTEPEIGRSLLHDLRVALEKEDARGRALDVYVSTYVFLENGWFIRPAEESHTVKVYNGILLTATGDDPFVPTSGAYNVQIKYSQPVATQAVIVETGVSGLTEEESTQLAEIDVISTKTDGLSGDLGKKLSTGQFLALK